MRSFLLFLFFATAAVAEDRALLIGNENYDTAGSIRGAAAVPDADRSLRAAGFSVMTGADLEAAGLRSELSRLANQTVQNGRVIILLSGHFASDSNDTYFLGTEADQPDAVSVSGVGLPLDAVLQVAARSPGGAAVLLGTEDRRLPLGPGLKPGVGQLDIPQGVTVIRGDAAEIADFAATAMTRRGVSLPYLLTGTDLRREGFLSALVAFRQAAGPVAPPVVNEDADEAMWKVTQQLDSLDAYRAYVRRFPDGEHAVEAELQIRSILSEPQRDARLAEDALTLSREDRRAIQRGLSVLGFDPRGIDGVFGAGSRTAIGNWQKRFGHAQTTYLTRDQIAQLSAQAERRAAELEAEAALRRAELERQDRQYWAETGKAGDEPGLRSYLRRFPDGVFADLANERLAVIEKAKRDRLVVQDRSAWEKARAENTVVAYRAYISANPRGAFVAQARAQIARLAPPEVDPAVARARAVEDGLNLSQTAKRLIELRLSSLELFPGEKDGVFTEETRRALQKYQTSRGLPATGYVDQVTMITLLAGG